jgi:hypothetical protein
MCEMQLSIEAIDRNIEVWVIWYTSTDYVSDKQACSEHTSVYDNLHHINIKLTHLSTSGVPSRSAFSSSLNSGAWTAMLSATGCTSAYIIKQYLSQPPKPRKHERERVSIILPFAGSSHTQGSCHTSTQTYPLVELHSRILHNPEDNHNNFDSIGWDQPDPVPNPAPVIITEKLRNTLQAHINKTQFWIPMKHNDYSL